MQFTIQPSQAHREVYTESTPRWLSEMYASRPDSLLPCTPV